MLEARRRQRLEERALEIELRITLLALREVLTDGVIDSSVSSPSR